MTWPECVAYTCGTCGEHTINEVGSPCIDANECPSCYALPALEQASEAPEHSAPPGSSTDASAGSPEAAPFPRGADPEAGAASPPTGGRRRTSGGADESGNPFFGGRSGDDGRADG